jgi:tRNA pseudouridine38-40 synthase
VHATGQVAHFDTGAKRSNRSWLRGINSNLPDDINALWVYTVGDNFHARFSARSRSYRYVILNCEIRSALQRHRVWWFRHELDITFMQAGADLLAGQHDFTSFRAASCQSKSPVRTVTELRVTRVEEHIHIDCTADAFLHHMVRNIVGSLVRVGQGDEPVAWIQQILDSRDRKHMGLTAPAAGLTLTAVEYPEEIYPGR